MPGGADGKDDESKTAKMVRGCQADDEVKLPLGGKTPGWAKKSDIGVGEDGLRDNPVQQGDVRDDIRPERCGEGGGDDVPRLGAGPG